MAKIEYDPKYWHMDELDQLFEWVEKMTPAFEALERIPKSHRPKIRLTMEVIDHE